MKEGSKIYMLNNPEFIPSEIYPVKGSRYESRGTIVSLGARIAAVQWDNGNSGQYYIKDLVVYEKNAAQEHPINYQAYPNKLGVFQDEVFTSTNNGVTITNSDKTLIFLNKKRYFKQLE